MSHILTFARSIPHRLSEVWYHTDRVPYFADAEGSNSDSRDGELERRRAVRDTCTARCDGLASLYPDARVNASQHCSDEGFRSHSPAGVARGGWVALESVEDRRRRRDERLEKDDAGYRRRRTVEETVRMAMSEDLVVTVNPAACEVVRIRAVGTRNRCSDD